MHSIVGRGIIVPLAGIFSLQLIISCQLFLDLVFLDLFPLLLGLDFFFGSSPFTSNLYIHNDDKEVSISDKNKRMK